MKGKIFVRLMSFLVVLSIVVQSNLPLLQVAVATTLNEEAEQTEATEVDETEVTSDDSTDSEETVVEDQNSNDEATEVDETEVTSDDSTDSEEAVVEDQDSDDEEDSGWAYFPQQEKVTTIQSVRIGAEYRAPFNTDVRVTLTSMDDPAVEAFLSITELTLTDDQIDSLNSLSDKAWDIELKDASGTDIENGTFTINVELPKPEGSYEELSIKYAETQEELNNPIEVGTVEATENRTTVEATLDHLTIFVVTDPGVPLDCSGTGLPVAAGDTCHANIQNAINSVAAGGTETITVLPGVYTEELIINRNRNITLVGNGITVADIDKTILQPTLDNSATSGQTLIIVESGSHLNLDGFTLERNSSANSTVGSTLRNYLNGIKVERDASADLYNVLFRNFYVVPNYNNTRTNPYAAWPVTYYGTGSVQNSVIRDFTGSGISVVGGGAYLRIINNVISGVGYQPTMNNAQNGIQVHSGANALIQSNVISDIRAAHAADATYSNRSTAILVEDIDSHEISNNTIQNSDVAIEIGEFASAILNGNNLAATEIDIRFDPDTNPGSVLRNNILRSGSDLIPAGEFAGFIMNVSNEYIDALHGNTYYNFAGTQITDFPIIEKNILHNCLSYITDYPQSRVLDITDCDSLDSTTYGVVDYIFVGASINGKIYQDDNLDGTIQNGAGGTDTGLGGWTVNLYDSTWSLVDTTISRPAGQIDFTELDLGVYYVCEVLNSAWAQTGPASTGARPVNLAGIAVTAGEPVSVENNSGNALEASLCWYVNASEQIEYKSLSLGNIETGTIAGIAWIDNGRIAAGVIDPALTLNGILDGDETGARNWTIELRTLGGTVIESTTTDADGNYMFEVIPGNYQICAIEQFSWVQSYPNTDSRSETFDCHNMTVASGDELGANFGLYRLSMIEGSKFFDADRNGTFDAGESTMDGWNISIYKLTNDLSAIDAPVTAVPLRTGDEALGKYRIMGLEIHFDPTDTVETFLVCEEGRGRWIQSHPSVGETSGTRDAAIGVNASDYGLTGYADVCYQVRVELGKQIKDVDFGNYAYNNIAGRRYIDANFDDMFDTADGDRAISGTAIRLYEENPAGGNWLAASDSRGNHEVMTDRDGKYEFVRLTVGNTYYVCSEEFAGWPQTSPTGAESRDLITMIGGTPEQINSTPNNSGIVGEEEFCWTVTINGDVDEVGEYKSVQFISSLTANIVGQKLDETGASIPWTVSLYSDVDGDGRWEATPDATGMSTRTTVLNGSGYKYHFLRLPLNTTYYVCEKNTDSSGDMWTQISPSDGETRSYIDLDGLGLGDMHSVRNASGMVDEADYCWEVVIGGIEGVEYKSVSFGNARTGRIQGKKFEDVDRNSAYTAGVDTPIAGWTMRLIDPTTWNTIATTTTAGSGQYAFSDLTFGTYIVCEENQLHWNQTYPAVGMTHADNGTAIARPRTTTLRDLGSNCWEVTVDASREFKMNHFLNEKVANITGRVYENLDADRMYNPGVDGNLTGWEVRLYDAGWAQIGSTTTDGSGKYAFNNLAFGDYYVCEVMQPFWNQIYSELGDSTADGANSIDRARGASMRDMSLQCWSVSVTNNQEYKGNHFGNVRITNVLISIFDDVNENGIFEEATDGRLGGWTVRMYDNLWNLMEEKTTVTTGDNTGKVHFLNVELNKTYYFCQVTEAGWRQTGPGAGDRPYDPSGRYTLDGIAIDNTNSSATALAEEGEICWEVTPTEMREYKAMKLGNTDSTTTIIPSPTPRSGGSRPSGRGTGSTTPTPTPTVTPETEVTPESTPEATTTATGGTGTAFTGTGGTGTVLGATEEPTPTPEVTEEDEAITEENGEVLAESESCEDCQYRFIFIVVNVVLSLLFAAIILRSMKDKRYGVAGIIIPIVLHIIFLWVNTCVESYALILTTATSFICKFFLPFNVLLNLVISYVFGKDSE